MEHSTAGVLKSACICICWHLSSPDRWKDISTRFCMWKALVSQGTMSTAQRKLKQKANAS